MIREEAIIYRCQFCDKEFHKKDDCLSHECEEHLNKDYDMESLIKVIEDYYSSYGYKVPSDISLLLRGDTPMINKLICSDIDGTPVSPSLLVLKLANIILSNLGNITIRIDDDIDYNKDGNKYTVVK